MVGLADGTLATLSGILASAVGMPVGAAKGIIKSFMDGTYGSQEGVNNAQKEMQGVVQSINPYFAQTPQGGEIVENVGKLLESGIPMAPMFGELAALQAGLKTAMPVIEHAATKTVQPIARTAGKVTPLLEEPTPLPRQSLKSINEENIVKQENAVTVAEEGASLTEGVAQAQKSKTVLTKNEFPEVSEKISQKQWRHVEGRRELRERKKGGYMKSIEDAEAVLAAYHSGKAEIIGKTRRGFPIVRVNGITGINVNKGANIL